MASAVASCLFLASAARFARAGEAGERPVRFALTPAGANGPLDGCGGVGALERAVEERLHRGVFTDAAVADITLVVAAEASSAAPRTWSAHIVEHDRAGTELGRRDVSIQADDCAKGLDTLAVVLAIMVGPERTTTAPPVFVPEPPPSPPSPPSPQRPPEKARLTPAVAPPSPPPSLPPSPPQERWTVSPLAEVVLGTGILPELSWGVQAGAIVRPPSSRVSFGARASYWPPRSTGPTGASSIDRLGGTLLGCFELVRPAPPSTWTSTPAGSRSALAVAICGGADAGRLHSTSSVLTRASETGLVLDVLAEGRVGYRLRGPGSLTFEPVLAAQAAVVLRGDRFRYRDVTGQERTLLEPSPVAFQASLGVVVHFL